MQQSSRALLVPIYLNRSKIGNLKVLRRYADEHELALVGLGNRRDGELEIFFDDFCVVAFSKEAMVEALTEEGSRRAIAGIFCLGEDEVPLCAELANTARLPGNSQRAALLSRSKSAMRVALRGTGVPMPRSYAVTSLDGARRLLATEYQGRSAFLKPALGTGSMYCREIPSDDALVIAWSELFECSRSSVAADPLYEDVFRHEYFMLLEDLIGTYHLPDDDVLSERFPVHELSVECVIADGRPHVYGITDKLVPLDGNGREHMWRTSRVPRSLQARLSQHVRRIVRALGLRVGGVHAEFRLEPAKQSVDAVIEGQPVQATLLEVAARMGGAYMQSFWRQSTGFDPVSWLADQACGASPATPQPTVLNPAIMLNIWPESSGTLVQVSEVEDFSRRAGKYLDDVVIYDHPGERVQAGPAAERGIGHIALRDPHTDALSTDPEVVAQQYRTLEQLFLWAFDHVRGTVEPRRYTADGVG